MLVFPENHLPVIPAIEFPLSSVIFPVSFSLSFFCTVVADNSMSAFPAENIFNSCSAKTE
jgi:hypothetical protein